MKSDAIDNNKFFTQDMKTQVEMARKISASYCDAEETIADEDKKFAEELFRAMIEKGDVKLRQVLAENLKDSAILPRNIAVALANDVPEVAAEMLECSPVLNEKDLLAIVKKEVELPLLLAMAQRLQLPLLVSNALFKLRNSSVTDMLLHNPDIIIAEKEYSHVIEDNSDNRAVIESIIERPLSTTTVEKLLRAVSPSIKDGLQKNYHVVFQSKDIGIVREKSLSKIRNQNYESHPQ